MVFIEDEKTWDFSEGIIFYNIIVARFDTGENELAICESGTYRNFYLYCFCPWKIEKVQSKVGYFRKIEKTFIPEKYSKSY